MSSRSRLILSFVFVCAQVFRLSAQQVFPVTIDIPIISSFTSAVSASGTNVYYDIWAGTLKRLVENIYQQKISIYDDTGKIVNLDDVRLNYQTGNYLDMSGRRYMTPEQKLMMHFYIQPELYHLINAMWIRQQWDISNTGVINKKVLSYAPYDMYGKTSDKMLFWIGPDSIKGSSRTFVMSYFVDIETLGDSTVQKEFINSLKENLRLGKASVYDRHNGARLSVADISSALEVQSGVDTIPLIDSTSLEEMTAVSRGAEKVQMIKVFFTEEWLVDDRGNFNIKVIKYSPMTLVHSASGKYTSWAPLFEVRCREE